MHLAEQGERHQLYVDDENPRIKTLHSCIAPIAFESVDGSGNFDSLYDFNLSQVNNNRLNGYLCTGAKYHTAFQTQPPTGNQPPQGTVGFGGRRGQHWLRFRLERFGYLHYPTRAFDGIGGTADYSTPLSTQTNTIQFGETPINISNSIEWRNLWSVNSAEIYLRWVAGARGLKEEVVLTQGARDWLRDNRPPTTPIDETYFVFLYQLDLDDVPRIFNNGLKDKDADFDDANGGTEFRNSLDDLLAFMPVDFAYVPRFGGRVRLRKRFFTQNGNHFLAVGARVDELNGLLDGDIIFDPTINPTISGVNDDTYTYIGNFYNTGAQYAGAASSNPIDAGLRWSGFTTIAAGSTIDSSNIQCYVQSTSDNPSVNIYADEASSAAWSTSDRPNLSNITETAANVTWSGMTAGAYRTSPSINTVIQEVIDTVGAISAIRLVLISTLGGNNYFAFDDSEDTNPSILNITWTEPASGPEDLSLNSASFTVTPTNVGLIASRLLSATSATFAITPTNLDLDLTRYLAAQSAAFAVTPTDIGLIKSSLLSLQSQSFAVTPTDISLDLTRYLANQSASFAITPTDVLLALTRQIGAQSATYTITPTDIGLIASRLLSLNSQTYTITPTDVGLEVAGSLILNSATFAITPTDISLDLTRYLAAQSATFAITPTNVELDLTRYLSAQSATFSITPTNIGLIASRLLALNSASYAVTPSDVALTAGGANIVALSASFTITPTDVGLIASRLLSLQSASYTITPSNIALDFTTPLAGLSATFAITPQNVVMVASRLLALNSASFLVTPTNLQLTYSAQAEFPDIDQPPSFVSNTGRISFSSQSPRFSYTSQTQRHTHESN